MSISCHKSSTASARRKKMPSVALDRPEYAHYKFNRIPLINLTGTRLHPLVAHQASHPIPAALPTSEPTSHRSTRPNALLRSCSTYLMRGCAQASIFECVARSYGRACLPDCMLYVQCLQFITNVPGRNSTLDLRRRRRLKA